MTDTFDIAAMIADRQAGTPGPWRLGSWLGNVFGTGPKDEWIPVCRVKRDDAPADESIYCVDARRIARVPEMEAEILRLREGLTEIERLYYTEAKDASWRACRCARGNEGAGRMSLMCDYGDYDEPSVYSATTQRARKEYCCGECSQQINTGDTYVRIFGVWDGDARTYFRCERCDDLIAAFTDVGYCYEIGGFLSSYAEWLDEAGNPRPQWLINIFDEWRTKHEAARKEQPHD